MPLRVQDLNGPAAPAWDEFVAACPEAGFFHRAGWSRVIQAAFGQKAHYLYAERDGQIVGVLPLIHMRSPLFGNRLVSTAFTTAGGTAALDEEARTALEAEAERRMAALGAQYVELRQPPRPHAEGGRWQARTGLYSTFERRIHADEQEDMKLINANKRRELRKALASDLSDRLERGPETFFPVYAETMRDLGTPVFGMRFFRLIAETFAGDCDCLVVSQGGEPLAASMNFYFRDRVILYFLGNRPRARECNATGFLLWRLARLSVARGFTLFDYGRSKTGTGNAAFKRMQGFTERPVANEFLMASGGAPPELNPTNPRYSRFIETWKKLPLPVANVVGPAVIRHIG